MNCDDHFFIFKVNIVKSINALCIIVRDSEIPYNTQDEKNETQHLQFTMEGSVPSFVLLMYKLTCEQTLLLREVTRERHALSLPLASCLSCLARHPMCGYSLASSPTRQLE